MAVTPIRAQCRRCLQQFSLFELLDERNGCCPRCGWMLSEDWVPELLRQARAADIAQRRLIAALRGLRDVPGNLALRPHTVLRNLFEEVGWERDLVEDPAALREELDELRGLLAAWEQLAPQTGEPVRRRGLVRGVLDAFAGRARRPEPGTIEPGAAEPAVAVVDGGDVPGRRRPDLQADLLHAGRSTGNS